MTSRLYIGLYVLRSIFVHQDGKYPGRNLSICPQARPKGDGMRGKLCPESHICQERLACVFSTFSSGEGTGTIFRIHD